jgi:hypothetical protein
MKNVTSEKERIEKHTIIVLLIVKKKIHVQTIKKIKMRNVKLVQKIYEISVLQNENNHENVEME